MGLQVPEGLFTTERRKGNVKSGLGQSHVGSERRSLESYWVWDAIVAKVCSRVKAGLCCRILLEATAIREIRQTRGEGHRRVCLRLLCCSRSTPPPENGKRLHNRLHCSDRSQGKDLIILLLKWHRHPNLGITPFTMGLQLYPNV